MSGGEQAGIALTSAESALRISASPGLAGWLSSQDASLAITTYQTGKLFLVSGGDGERPSIFERTFAKAMGLHATGDGLLLSTLYQVWRFENALEAGQQHEGYDRLYVPRVAWTTGDVDVHDVVEEAGGRIVFVSTLFNCLATVSERYSFLPVWKPPFVSGLAPQDRCHLNGVALREGRARYATCVACSDTPDGWREQRAAGGAVIDVGSGAVVARELSMPHSPRFHGERLWLLNSGAGLVGFVDLQSGRFVPVCFCPGYLRGLAFVGGFAVAGLSRPRANGSFSGLPLDELLRKRAMDAQCGVQVVDLRSGNRVHWLRFEGVVEELYDIVALPGVRRPMALGFKTDEIHRYIRLGPWQEGALTRLEGQ